MRRRFNSSNPIWAASTKTSNLLTLPSVDDTDVVGGSSFAMSGAVIGVWFPGNSKLLSSKLFSRVAVISL